MLLIDELLELIKDKRLIGVTKRKLFNKDRTVRHRAKKKLFDNVLLKDFNDDKLSFVKKFYIFTLLRFKQKDSKIKFGEKILKESIEKEYFLFSLEICEVLLVHSMLTELKEKYLNLYHQILDKINNESTIVLNYIEILNGGKPNDVKALTKRGMFFYYYARVSYWEKINESKTAHYCKEALKEIESEKGKLHFQFKYLTHVVRCENSNLYILDYISQEKGNNRHLGYVYNALYWTRRDFYNKSINTIQEVVKDVHTSYTLELLNIIEAWNYLMIDDNFKFSKFLNDIIIFARQKSEDNAGLILLKFLYWFKKGNTNKVIDNEISLKRYAKRYVTGRMLVMYQFIFLFIKHSFKPPISELERLKSELNTFPPLDINIEIVPFEVIVERFFVP